MKTVNKKLEITLLIFSSIFWFAILTSLSLFMMHWRVKHEPGAGDGSGLLFAHKITFWTGLIGALGTDVFLISKKPKILPKILIGLSIAIGIYSPLFAITLLMMV